ncbi:hypothetical protein AXK11_06245 [Cephaloticoccus primus]|uniref:UDP-N-acetylmuramoylalanine--D-glutamate ligase n=1 Tax=Cephaloticoccus primus TaxID=1548207 RepID=A0A139SLP7_9BACT|nr:UDP-N-acetylmuramoyl-L-alanine--D-glutamate ligase [Cephaloticoccus primus]KXU35479.1 hypothetical protein AXK11_06245 [Cephaloticoccus primus]
MKLRVPFILEFALEKPVAVFGAGVSGRAVQALLEKVGAEGRLYDEVSGPEFGEAQCAEHSLVVFSPGFVTDHRWLVLARERGLWCMGELDFSALFWRGLMEARSVRHELVAVTGTNGKTTLTEFLTHALRENGECAHAAGNIGKPLAQLVVESAAGKDERPQIVICEVSSFQAESLQHFRADSLLWTNFAEDHLDRHGSLEQYFGAKARLLAAVPADSVFIGACVARAARQFEQAVPPYATMRCESPFFSEQLKGTFCEGPPQQDNFRLALSWWWRSDRSPELLYQAAQSFSVGPHRLSPVATVSGVSYWNDSKATNFHAVEQALAYFARAQTPVYLILGGRAKGGDLAGFVGRIAARVRHAFLIGETAPLLAPLCAAQGLSYESCDSLEEAVWAASRAAPPASAILLSPGFASFDSFRNYQERGEAFEAAVRALAANPHQVPHFSI